VAAPAPLTTGKDTTLAYDETTVFALPDARDEAKRLRGAFSRTSIPTEEPVSSKQLADLLNRCSDEQLNEAEHVIAGADR
jgi:hypothetical protein